MQASKQSNLRLRKPQPPPRIPSLSLKKPPIAESGGALALKPADDSPVRSAVFSYAKIRRDTPPLFSSQPRKSDLLRPGDSILKPNRVGSRSLHRRPRTRPG